VTELLIVVLCQVSEWVIDCCFMPSEQSFSCIMARIISTRWWWCSFSTRPTRLVGIL